MSIRAQLAFGKNFTLQKQLEDKYLNLRRTFKHTRRRLDTMEEECIAALYKLLLYSREKQGLPETSDADVFNDLFKKPKPGDTRRAMSVADMRRPDENVSRRPATAMSAKAYTQSFSFVKDGLNIERTRRDRFMRTKAEREKDKENNIKVERMTDDWQLLKMNRPMTAVDQTNSEEESKYNDHGALSMRPKTACSQPNKKPEFKGLLSRPRTRNTLRTPLVDSSVVQRSSTPLAETKSHSEIPLTRTYSENIQENGELRGDGMQSQTQINRTDTPCLKTVHEGQARLDGTRSPLIVRITTTRLNDMVNSGKQTQNIQSFLDNSDDEELIPLNEDDKNKLNELVNTNHNDSIKVRGSPHRPATSVGLSHSRNTSTPSIPDNTLLRKSAQKTQSFLTQYSKKSKVFGYVVKTRSSILAPRERLVSHRSPCITYQELASIKAGIKQHESKTRSLLQRSAKLSTYVDKLATAGEMRKRMQELKEKSKSK